MNRIQPGLWLLAVALVLGNGCSTHQVLNQSYQTEPEHYRFERLEQAYETPAGDLVLCVWGTLPGRRQSAAYTLHVPGEQLRRAPSDLAYRGHLVEVARLAVQSGWPQATEVHRRNWQTLSLERTDRAHAVGPDADAFRAGLPLPPATQAALYRVGGYGAGDGMELVWVRQGSAIGSVTRQAFTLKPLIRHEFRGLSDLPGALIRDVAGLLGHLFAGASGVLVGGPLCARLAVIGVDNPASPTVLAGA